LPGRLFPRLFSRHPKQTRSASIAGEGVETSECCWKEAALFATLTRGPDTLLYRTIDSKRFLAHAASIASRTSLGDSLIRKFQHRALLFNKAYESRAVTMYELPSRKTANPDRHFMFPIWLENGLQLSTHLLLQSPILEMSDANLRMRVPVLPNVVPQPGAVAE